MGELVSDYLVLRWARAFITFKNLDRIIEKLVLECSPFQASENSRSDEMHFNHFS
jgi:hypothetical protein